MNQQLKLIYELEDEYGPAVWTDPKMKDDPRVQLVRKKPVFEYKKPKKPKKPKKSIKYPLKLNKSDIARVVARNKNLESAATTLHVTINELTQLVKKYKISTNHMWREYVVISKQNESEIVKARYHAEAIKLSTFTPKAGLQAKVFKEKKILSQAEAKCSVCGKSCIITNKHVYKFKYNNMYQCSYTCYLKAKRGK